MEIIGQIINVCMDVMRTPFTIWGRTISLWNAFTFAVVLGAVAWAVWKVILDE